MLNPDDISSNYFEALTNLIVEKFNSIDRGKRVWSKGYPNHGPLERAKTDITTNIGSTIVAFSRPYLTNVKALYYYKELQPMGTCKDWAEYEQILSTEENAKVTFGPRGGFKKLEMTTVQPLA